MKNSRKCKNCNIDYNTYSKNSKFCSRKCYFAFIIKNNHNFKIHNCVNCNKKLNYSRQLDGLRFCSLKCRSKYMAKNKLGAYNKKSRNKAKKTKYKSDKIKFLIKMSKRIRCNNCNKLTNNNKFCSGPCVREYFKMYKIGWFNPEIRRKAAKNAALTNKKNGASFCFDKKLQSKAGKIGCLITNKKLRQHKRIFWKGNYFGSGFERDVAKILIKNKILIKIIEGINFQVCIDSLTVDFLIKKYKCIIEPHCFFKLNRNKKMLSRTKYYNYRRKVLDTNGYKDYKLFVVENLKELEDLITKLRY